MFKTKIQKNFKLSLQTQKYIWPNENSQYIYQPGPSQEKKETHMYFKQKKNHCKKLVTHTYLRPSIKWELQGNSNTITVGRGYQFQVWGYKVEPSILEKGLWSWCSGVGERTLPKRPASDTSEGCGEASSEEQQDGAAWSQPLLLA